MCNEWQDFSIYTHSLEISQNLDKKIFASFAISMIHCLRWLHAFIGRYIVARYLSCGIWLLKMSANDNSVLIKTYLDPVYRESLIFYITSTINFSMINHDSQIIAIYTTYKSLMHQLSFWLPRILGTIPGDISVMSLLLFFWTNICSKKERETKFVNYFKNIKSYLWSIL